jgi:2-iminobutanoate/2-iminopropanoate deaminase
MKQILFTDAAPKAVGPYSQAVAHGDTVFTSGQLGIDMATSSKLPCF